METLQWIPHIKVSKAKWIWNNIIASPNRGPPCGCCMTYLGCYAGWWSRRRSQLKVGQQVSISLARGHARQVLWMIRLIGWLKIDSMLPRLSLGLFSLSWQTTTIKHIISALQHCVLWIILFFYEVELFRSGVGLDTQSIFSTPRIIQKENNQTDFLN